MSAYNFATDIFFDLLPITYNYNPCTKKLSKNILSSMAPYKANEPPEANPQNAAPKFYIKKRLQNSFFQWKCIYLTEMGVNRSISKMKETFNFWSRVTQKIGMGFTQCAARSICFICFVFCTPPLIYIMRCVCFRNLSLFI